MTAAALLMPRVTTRLSELEKAEVSVTWRRVRHPAEAVCCETLKDVQEHISRAGQLYMKFIASLFSPVVASEAERAPYAVKETMKESA